MAVLMVGEIPASLDQYKQVNEKMDAEANPPEGLIVHTAQAIDGGVRIVDVWESEDAYNRFRAERLGAAVEAVVGAAPDEQPGGEIRQLDNVIRGR
jgi:hypothetical protein